LSRVVFVRAAASQSRVNALMQRAARTRVFAPSVKFDDPQKIAGIDDW
jgi:hypothetical protein